MYSDQYTGSQLEGAASEAARFIQRIPFFTLVKRVYDERDETAEELRDQLDAVKKRYIKVHLILLLGPQQVIFMILPCVGYFKNQQLSISLSIQTFH